MLTRIILTGIVIAVVIMFYRKLQQAKHKKSAAPPPAAMKKCAHCGIHLPQGDALQSGEHFYCSEQHRLQHQQNQDRHD